MGFWGSFLEGLSGNTNDDNYSAEDSGIKLTLGSYKNKCGTCTNWTGTRDQSYLGIGTRYVKVYEDKARCALNGCSGSNNYHYASHCRENNCYSPCANLD